MQANGLSSQSWNSRPVAVDVLACPADTFTVPEGGHAPRRFSLKLSAATVAHLRREAEALEPAPTADKLFAAARFARELGDLAAAREAAVETARIAPPELEETVARFIDDELSTKLPPA